MDEYIKRADAIAAFDDYRADYYYGNVSPESVIFVIKTIPAADVREVVRGEWVLDTIYPSGVKKFHCSVCGQDRTVHEKYEGVFRQNFCPNCGADMRKPTKEDGK